MRRDFWVPALVAAGLSLAAACSSNNNYACVGLCTAPDGGSVGLDKVLSSDSLTDAQAACLQQMGTSLGITCTASNASCTCAQQ